MNKKLNQSAQQVANFMDEVCQNGLSVVIKGECIVCVSCKFNAGDHNEYSRSYQSVLNALEFVPARGGSIWGSDSSTIGGYVALKEGKMVMNKSGANKRFIKALREVLD
jgi:hypothetical protein